MGQALQRAVTPALVPVLTSHLQPPGDSQEESQETPREVTEITEITEEEEGKEEREREVPGSLQHSPRDRTSGPQKPECHRPLPGFLCLATASERQHSVAGTLQVA